MPAGCRAPLVPQRHARLRFLLTRGAEIDDRRSAMAKSNAGRLPSTFHVGATRGQSERHTHDPTRIELNPGWVDNTADTAHAGSSLAYSHVRWAIGVDGRAPPRARPCLSRPEPGCHAGALLIHHLALDLPLRVRAHLAACAVEHAPVRSVVHQVHAHPPGHADHGGILDGSDPAAVGHPG